MDISNKYCFFVGTARGTIQYTHCRPNEKVPFSIPDEQSEITALEWGRSEDEMIIGYKNESVQLYNSSLNKYTKTINSLEGEGPIVGVGALEEALIIGKREGVITIWNGKKTDFFSINLQEKGSMDCMKVNQNIVATGGEFNDLQLWDLETQKNIFKAKSLGHDQLNLPIPTSVRGIAFLPEHERLTACATKEGHVLLYDERAQRRPIIKFLEKKASYTCIASAWRDRQCLVGTTKGYMQLLDLKAPGKCMKTFTTFTGSVTSIVCDPLEPFVATTSLDRFLRVHNLDTKELVHKAYLKHNLTKILMKPIVKKEEDEEKVAEPIDEEYEDLFNNMETIVEKSTKKSKRKSLSEDGIKKKKKKVPADV